MHSGAVVAFRTTLCRTNRSNSIFALVTTSRRTRPGFRSLSTPYGTFMKGVGEISGDKRAFSTALTLGVDEHLLGGNLANSAEQAGSVIETSTTLLELDTGLSSAMQEQLPNSTLLAGADPQVEELVVPGNMIQPPDDNPEPLNTERQYGPIDLAFKPIPPLPPPVSGWPTPWAEQTDIEQYLLPLYGRGWGISFKLSKLKAHTNAAKDDQPKAKILGPPRSSAYLVVEYEFDNYQAAADFVTRVASIATTEDHHPKTLTIMNATNPTVSLKVHTDSAKRPMWDQPLHRKLAGITLRDLRFAVLVETLYSDSYGEGRDHKRLIRPLEHRPQWAKFLRVLRKFSLVKTPSPSPPGSPTPSPDPRNLKGGSTPKDKATLGSTLANVCTMCGMNHPSEICPLNRPFSVCPSCGGSHWLADCPQTEADKAPTV